MRILLIALLYVGISFSPALLADIYKACGNSLIGLHKAQEHALDRALQARELDGRNTDHSYKVEITFSVRDLNIDFDIVRESHTFEWKACVEVSDIPAPIDISKQPNCIQIDFGWPGEGLLSTFPYGQIVPIAYSLYLAPITFDGSESSYWYRCAEIQKATPSINDNKLICGHSLKGISGAFSAAHEQFSKWYVGRQRYLVGGEKTVELKYAGARSALNWWDTKFGWEVCIVPPAHNQ